MAAAPSSSLGSPHPFRAEWPNTFGAVPSSSLGQN
jgi:hypothetical protein